jgi:hypothetical protein
MRAEPRVAASLSLEEGRQDQDSRLGERCWHAVLQAREWPAAAAALPHHAAA